MFRHVLTICAISLVLAGCASDKKAADPATPPPPKPADAAVVVNSADAAVAVAEPATPDAGAEPIDEPLPAKKKLEAIKVLPKTWSYDQVKKYMEDKVAVGLGQKCVFCHDPKNFTADKPRKTLAREMITMTNDLNKKYFAGKPRISCITCHKGKAEPEPK
jgi:hypothetical protein